jgi:hypothetical protein
MSGQCRRAEVLTIGMEVLRLVRDTIGSTGEDKVKVVNSLMEDSIDNIVIDQCGDEFKEDIIRPALKRGLSCLTNLGGNGPSYAAQIIGLLQNRDNMNPLNVKCGSDQADSLGIPESARNISPQEYVNGLANGSITARPSATGAAALTCDGDWPKVSMFPGNGVGINPDKRFSAEELKKQQQATFFHELFHNLGFYHNSGAVDLTYICTFSCFSDHTYKKIAKDAPNFNDTRFESTVHEAKRLCRTAESTPRRSPGENWRTSVASSGYTNGTFANGRILHDVLKFSTGAASIAMNRAFLYYDQSFAESLGRDGLNQQSGIEELLYGFAYSGPNASDSVLRQQRQLLYNLAERAPTDQRSKIKDSIDDIRAVMLRMPLQPEQTHDEDKDVRDYSNDALRLKNAYIRFKKAGKAVSNPEIAAMYQKMSASTKHAWQMYCNRLNYKYHDINFGVAWFDDTYPIREGKYCEE